MKIWCWAFFHIIPVDHYFIYFILFVMGISHFAKCLFRSLAYFSIKLFIFSLLCFKSSLYILDKFFKMCLLQIFPLSMACLLILLTLTFTYQTFLMLMKFTLSITFIHFSFGVVFKNSPPNLRWPRFFSMLSSRSSIVFHITFRFVFHFEVSFCQKYMNCV